MSTLKCTIESILDIWPIQSSITCSFNYIDFCKCILVSKEWCRIFTPLLWKTVKLSDHPPDPATLQRTSSLIQELIFYYVESLPPTDLASERARDCNSVSLTAGQEHSPHSFLDQGSVNSFTGVPSTAVVGSDPPFFTNLKVIRWLPRQRPGTDRAPEVRRRRSLDLIRFLESHTSVQFAHLEFVYYMAVDDAIMELLCRVIENHPGLKQFTLTGRWINTPRRAQRLFCACRRFQEDQHLFGDSIMFDAGLRKDDYNYGANHSGVMPSAIRLQSRYSVEADIREKPVWEPIINNSNNNNEKEAIKIRSLSIDHSYFSREFWIFFPVFKMCTWLERLEIETENLEQMVPALRECLHQSCPSLSFLRIVNTHKEAQVLNWALALLCPSTCKNSRQAREQGKEQDRALATFKPIPFYFYGKLHPMDLEFIYGSVAATITSTTSSATTTTAVAAAAGTTSMTRRRRLQADHTQDCAGFRLKSFYPHDPSSFPKSKSQSSPKPWSSLLDHHGSTLLHLNVATLRMSLTQMRRFLCQIPGLLTFKAEAVWSKSGEVHVRKVIEKYDLMKNRCRPRVLI
ncbi:hypothetical protein BGZ83_006892 [Gryganskiella cystojenkinii]|nr:hypothetical protein BGZ83_006892 [Gryganskiella cystojenkinii]